MCTVYSLSSRGVNQQCDQGGGGRTHTVQGQHSVLKLFLTNHMICRTNTEEKAIIGEKVKTSKKHIMLDWCLRSKRTQKHKLV